MIRTQTILLVCRTHANSHPCTSSEPGSGGDIDKLSAKLESTSKPFRAESVGVRGKAGTPVEFGAKFSVSVVDGYVFLDRLGWENYHEAHDLTDHIERYRERFGYYPESVHVDKTYRNRENLRYCKSLGIRVSGPALGRPPKDHEFLKHQKRQIREDEAARIPVEGKFGNGKRRYGLDRIMAKRDDTSETVIGLIVLVMNLEKVDRDLLFALFRRREYAGNSIPMRFEMLKQWPNWYQKAA